MASDIMGFVKFQDGSFASLVKEGATLSGTADELQTGGVGLNQVSGVSIGQAYSGKVAIAAHIVCIKDGTNTTPGTGNGFSYGYFLGPDGKIICLVQGGGGSSSGLSPLSKPVRMQTGVTLQAGSVAATDGVVSAACAVYCSDGTSDVFRGTGVDATQVSMTNKDGATLGQALAGKKLIKAYATYNATKGLNEDGAGVGAFFHESAEGQLKMMFPPCQGNSQDPVPWIPCYGTTVLQNDTLKVTATT